MAANGINQAAGRDGAAQHVNRNGNDLRSEIYSALGDLGAR